MTAEATAGAAPPSPADIVQGVSNVVNAAQEALAEITAAVNGGGASSGSGSLAQQAAGAAASVQAAASNLSAAANLERALPLIVVIAGVLAGKPVYGLLGGAGLYLYLNA